MQIVYTGEHARFDADKIMRGAFHRYLRDSIFLAGPTPREASVASWRPAALEHFKNIGFRGVVFMPEWRDPGKQVTFLDQVEWETECLSLARCILFWIPRDMESLPGLTTNDEWGYWKASGKCVLGVPPGAAHTRYQLWWADKLGVPTFSSLAATCGAAVAMAQRGPAIPSTELETFEAEARKKLGDKLR